MRGRGGGEELREGYKVPGSHTQGHGRRENRHRALEAREELPFSLALGKKQEARALLSAAAWTQGRTSQGRVLLAGELLSAYEH